VHNPGFMTRDVQLQVFQRSFSTKGAGRGLGTYSIKLLTERYLKGTVSFTTDPEAGTTFRVRYPLTLEA
jgi:signal transduction histidine kinase